MTYKEFAFAQESKDYRDGYNAACAFEPIDLSKGAEWFVGYEQAVDDLSKE